MKKNFTILLAVFFTSYLSAQNINDSLIAFYPFNGNANDASGKSNNGTISGATLTTDRFGNSNSAYEFDGTNDYIEISDAPSLDLDYKFSISVWIYQTSTINTGYRIIDKNTAGFPDGYGIDTRGDNGGKRGRLYFKDQMFVASADHNLSEWVHLVITYDSTEAKFYINGQLKNSLTYNGINPPTNNLPLLIGAGQDNGVKQNFFQGKIDDVRIYKRALSSSEITMLFSGPISSTGSAASKPTVELYPNPTSNGVVSISSGYEVIGVTNVIGQTINYMFDNQNNTLTVNEPAGVYMVQVKELTTGSIQTIRLNKN